MRPMTSRAKAALAAVPLMLALALTGCAGGDDEGSQVASVEGANEQADNGDTSGGNGGTEDLSPEEMGVKFAECMRENGVHVDDPKPGEGIMLKFDKKSGVDQATVEQAMEACREYSPQAKKDNPQVEAKAQEFAECMRENGVESFEDPQPGQMGIRITPETGNDPDFEQAQEQCSDILGR